MSTNKLPRDPADSKPSLPATKMKGGILHRPGRPSPWSVPWREPETKKQCWKSFATKREAEGFRDTVRTSIRQGAYVSLRPTPFKEWAEDRLARRKPTVSPNTAVSYEWAVNNYLVPAFGAMPLQSFARSASNGGRRAYWGKAT